MHHTAFDQRNELIGIATPRGFIIFDCTIKNVLYEAIFPAGGANCIALLSDSNLVAASGDDSRNGFLKSTIILWECQESKIVRLLEVSDPVEYLYFRNDCLVAVYGSYINFYDCNNFTLIYKTANPIPHRFCVALTQSGSNNLVAFPSPSGDQLNISDYHDPKQILGSIPIQFSHINYFTFDSKCELLAIVIDEGRIIQLWSVMELKLLAKFKRGFWTAEVNGLAFDHLSNYFIMTTKRGTMHVFEIPAKKDMIDTSKTSRSTFSFELLKGTEFNYQFDNAGYIISGITDDGYFQQLRLDINKKVIVPLSDSIKIEM